MCICVNVSVCLCVGLCACADTYTCVYKEPTVPATIPSQKPTSQCSSRLSLSLQTILVGDSGVGKTSLLVQFDQGKFIPGSFSATVGIGFTVSAPRPGAPVGCQGPSRKQVVTHIGSFQEV